MVLSDKNKCSKLVVIPLYENHEKNLRLRHRRHHRLASSTPQFPRLRQNACTHFRQRITPFIDKRNNLFQIS